MRSADASMARQIGNSRGSTGGGGGAGIEKFATWISPLAAGIARGNLASLVGAFVAFCSTAGVPIEPERACPGWPSAR